MDVKKVAALGLVAVAVLLMAAPAGAWFGPFGCGSLFPFGLFGCPVPVPVAVPVPVPAAIPACSPCGPIGAGVGLGGCDVGLPGPGIGGWGAPGVGLGGCDVGLPGPGLGGYGGAAGIGSPVGLGSGCGIGSPLGIGGGPGIGGYGGAAGIGSPVGLGSGCGIGSQLGVGSGYGLGSSLGSGIWPVRWATAAPTARAARSAWAASMVLAASTGQPVR